MSARKTQTPFDRIAFAFSLIPVLFVAVTNFVALSRGMFAVDQAQLRDPASEQGATAKEFLLDETPIGFDGF